MSRPDIDWYAALADAERFAGSTADTGERNLARAYLELLREAGYLRLQRDKERERLELSHA